MARHAPIMYIADFETTTGNTEYFKKNNDSIVHIGYMRALLNKNENYQFLKIEDFFNILRDIGKSITVYFHNLSFDGYFIIKYLEKNYLHYNNKLPPRRAGFSFLRNGNRIYEIKYQYASRKSGYKKIVFKCSYNILSASVETLGNHININKLENVTDNFYDIEPLNNWDDYPKNFIDYLINDVEIVRQSLLNFDKSYAKIPLPKKPKWYNSLTASGLGLKIQKAYFRLFIIDKFDDKKLVSQFRISRQTYDIANKFFYAGWTQFAPVVQGKLYKCADGIEYDINSAHPASMTKRLPYGEIYEDGGNIPPTAIIFYHLKITSAFRKFPNVINLLNWNKRHKHNQKIDIDAHNRYQPALNDFEAYYMAEEWAILQKFYNFEGVKIIKTYWAHSAEYLADYVHDLYNIRMEYKKEKNKAMEHAYKIILNGSYGKHAQRPIFSDEFGVPASEYNNFVEQPDIIVSKKKYLYLRENKGMASENYRYAVCENLDDPKDFPNKLAAAVITANTRINLWQTILQLGPENFLYGDTDSIYTNKRNDTAINYHDTKLGAWGAGEAFNYIIVKGAKSYCLFDEKLEPIKGKYSGISNKYVKKHLSLSLYERMDELENANLRPTYLQSGIILELKNYIPKERHL